MKIKGILIDVYGEFAEIIETEDSLKSWYSLLDCRSVDIVSRRIGEGNHKKIIVDIVCDDEALFKNPQKISAIDDLGRPQLTGNIFITGPADDEGVLTSLSDSDIRCIRNKILKMSTRNFPKGYPMLTQCEYY